MPTARGIAVLGCALTLSHLVGAEEQAVVIGGRETRVVVTPADPNEPSAEETLFGGPATAAAPGAAAGIAAPAASPAGNSRPADASAASATRAERAAVVIPQPAQRTPMLVGVGNPGAQTGPLPAVSAGSSAPPRPETPLAPAVLAADGTLLVQNGQRDLVAVLLTSPTSLGTVVLSGLHESGGVQALSAVQSATLAAPATAVALARAGTAEAPVLVAVLAQAEGAVVLSTAPATGTPTWSAPVATPLTLGAEGRLGAGAGDVDGDGTPDLVVAALTTTASGPSLAYAVGFGLTAQGTASSWTAWYPIKAAFPEGVRDLDVDLGQTTLNPKPELLVHLLATQDNRLSLRTLVGINAGREGQVEGWIARDQALGTTADRVVGLATASWTDAAKGTDVALLWIEQATAGAFGGFAVLNNLPLAPPYKPSPADLSARGDPATDLSVAAVKAQQVAGIRSPYQLRARVDPLLAQWRTQRQLPADTRLPKAEALPLIATALDGIEPTLPAAVRPELTKLILTLYGYSPEVGL